jgi:broad specificity phosphatase PhoE
MEQKMYRFLLLRHGRSTSDDEVRHEGRYDAELTSIGEHQAELTADMLAKSEYEFDSIISSPLKRAMKTAQIINKKLNLQIIEDEYLMEQDNGILAGMLKKDTAKKYPMPEFVNPFRYFPENSGENDFMLHSRGALALNNLMKNRPGQYLVIGHGGILNALIRNMLGINVKVNGSGVTFLLRDNGFVKIDYDEKKHHWIIRGIYEGYK